METNLAHKLIDDHILDIESKVTARVRAKGLDGLPIEVEKELVLSEISEGKFQGYPYAEPNIFYHFQTGDITKIEGMDLKRFAKAYNLKEDGSPLKASKKTGIKSVRE